MKRFCPAEREKRNTKLSGNTKEKECRAGKEILSFLKKKKIYKLLISDALTT